VRKTLGSEELWRRKWIVRRNSCGGSALLLKEIVLKTGQIYSLLENVTFIVIPYST
jgi:hypothetical protein